MSLRCSILSNGNVVFRTKLDTPLPVHEEEANEYHWDTPYADADVGVNTKFPKRNNKKRGKKPPKNIKTTQRINRRRYVKHKSRFIDEKNNDNEKFVFLFGDVYKFGQDQWGGKNSTQLGWY